EPAGGEVGEVVPVLDQAAERLLDRRAIEETDPVSAVPAVLYMEPEEGLRPVDRLRHARRLGEPPAAEGLDDAGDLLGQAGGRSRHAGAEDADLLVERRVLYVEVEAAPAEGVADLAGAVRGEDDEGDVLGRDRPQLRDRHLEVGEDLEEERL